MCVCLFVCVFLSICDQIKYILCFYFGIDVIYKLTININKYILITINVQTQFVLKKKIK